VHHEVGRPQGQGEIVAGVRAFPGKMLRIRTDFLRAVYSVADEKERRVRHAKRLIERNIAAK
jgi:hypothetical protein